MNTTLHDTAQPATEPMELLRIMLEDEFAVQTSRLTQLTVYARQPGYAGYDPHTLEILAVAARQRIADTAHALRRMSEGTYGICAGCDKPIPLGRLRTVPSVSHCSMCEPGYRDVA